MSFGKAGRSIKRTFRKEWRRTSPSGASKTLSRIKRSTRGKATSATKRYAALHTERQIRRMLGGSVVTTAGSGVGAGVLLSKQFKSKKSKPGSKSFNK